MTKMNLPADWHVGLGVYGEYGGSVDTPLDAITKAYTRAAERASTTAGLTSTTAAITLLHHGSKIGKQFFVRDGKLAKDTRATFFDGTADVREVRTASDMAAALAGLNPEHHVLAMGRPVSGEGHAHVVTEANLSESKIARSQKYFGYSAAAPSWVVLDLDLKDVPDHARVTIDAFGGPMKALKHLLPTLPHAAVVIRPSSSGGVYLEGETPGEVTGWHVFVQVAPGVDPDVFLRFLKAREWQLGLAWWSVSASGARLERGLTDSSVGGPERLTFTADPVLGEGVCRDAPAMQWQDGEPLGLPADINFEAAAEAKQVAYDAIWPEAQHVREEWIEERAVELAVRNGISVEEARSIVRELREGGVLHDDFVLVMHDRIPQRVGDLLDEIEAQNEAGARGKFTSLVDPMEDRNASATGASLVWNEGHASPVIVSHSHGVKKTYSFARYDNQPEPTPQPTKPDSDRAALLDSQTSRMKSVSAGWLKPIIETMQVRAAVIASDEAADEAVEYLIPDDDAGQPEIHEYHRARRTAIRTGRREIQARFNLPELPTRNYTSPHGYTPDLGTVKSHVQICGAQGIGKSTMFFGHDGSGDFGKRSGLAHTAVAASMMYSQMTLAKAEESFETYRTNMTEDSPVPALVRGRGAINPETGKPMCIIHKQAEKIAKLGLSVNGVLCYACPFHEQCSYKQQEKFLQGLEKDPRGKAAFCDQSYIRNGLPGNVMVHAIVNDEAIRDLMVDSFIITPQMIMDAKPPRSGGDKRQADIDAGWAMEVAPVLKRILKAMKAGWPSVDMIMAQLRPLTTSEALSACGAVLSGYSDTSLRGYVEKSLDGVARTRKLVKQSVDSALTNYKNSTPYKALAALCDVLAAEMKAIEAGKSKVDGIWIRTSKTGKNTMKVKRIAKLRHDVPMIHLDGTGSGDLAAAMFGSPFQEFKIDVPRNCTTTYVDGKSFAKSRLCGGFGTTEEEAARFRKEVHDTILADADTKGLEISEILVTMPKKVFELMKADGLELAQRESAIATYGSLRGLDGYKSAQAVYVVGGQVPEPSQFEEIVSAYKVGEPENWTRVGEWYVNEPKTLMLPNGTTAEVKTLGHPDPIGQMLLEQIADAEINQALDRIRLMFNAETKNVVLMTGVAPKNVVIDNVIEWSEFSASKRLEVNVLNTFGFIPTSPKQMAMFSALADDKRNGSCFQLDSLLGLATISLKSNMRYQNAVARAEQIPGIIHSDHRRLARKLPVGGSWFRLSLKHKSNPLEKRPRAFGAIGHAFDAAVMHKRVLDFYEAAPLDLVEDSLTIEKIEPQSRDIIAVATPEPIDAEAIFEEIIRQQVMSGADDIITEGFEPPSDAVPYVILDAKMVGENLRNAASLTGTAYRKIGKIKWWGHETPRYHYAVQVVTPYTPSAGQKDWLFALFVTDLCETETKALYAASIGSLRDHGVRDVSSRTDKQISRATTRKIIRRFHDRDEALQWASDNARWFDSFDGIAATQAVLDRREEDF